MISNGEIRSNVTERIRPIRLKLFGYTMVYSIILGVINSSISGVFYMIASLLAAVIIIPITLFTNISSDNAQELSDFLIQGFSYIASIFISMFMFILSVGFIKEIILGIINNGNTVSPLDFFKYGFEDYKRLIKVYFRLFLKSLPGTILLSLGIIVLILGLVIANPVFVSVSVSIIGLLMMIAGIIWTIVISILYQTVSYDLIHDEQGLEAKDILIKSRETIHGHIWQWTKMNYFYVFMISLIMIFFTVLFVILLSFSIFLASNAGNGASLFGILILFISVIVFVVGIIAASVLLMYFSSKNIINLDELYKAIKSEPREEVNLVY